MRTTRVTDFWIRNARINPEPINCVSRFPKLQITLKIIFLFTFNGYSLLAGIAPDNTLCLLLSSPEIRGFSMDRTKMSITKHRRNWQRGRTVNCAIKLCKLYYNFVRYSIWRDMRTRLWKLLWGRFPRRLHPVGFVRVNDAMERTYSILLRLHG